MVIGPEVISAITLFLTVAEKLFKGTRVVLKNWRRTTSASSSRFEPIDLSWLRECQDYLKSAKDLGLPSQASESLLEELLSSLQHVQELLNCKATSKQDIEDYQKRFISKFKKQVESALSELPKNYDMQCMVRTDANTNDTFIILKLNKELQLVSVVTSIIQKEATYNPVLLEALPFVQNMAFPNIQTFRMFCNKMLAFEHHDPLLPTLRAPGVENEGTREIMTTNNIAGTGMLLKERGVNALKVEKSNPDNRKTGTVEEMVPNNVGMLVKEEVGVNSKTQEPVEKTLKQRASDKEEEVGVNTQKVESEKTKQRASDKEQQQVNVLCNPNRNLKLAELKGSGAVHVSKCAGNQWRVKYQVPSRVMRVVSGETPMQVCPVLGYSYYEVKIMRMQDEQEDWCGVGLARSLPAEMVAGCYSYSYGYHGKSKTAYCEGSPHYFHTGGFTVGDTFGIRLFKQHKGSPVVFLTKNGVLKGCMSNPRLKKCLGCLYPMISLASLDVEVQVNFHDPFRYTSFPDLVVEAAKTSF